MVTAGTYPPISIDLGKDEPGMILQYRGVEGDYVIWRDFVVDSTTVKSPVELITCLGVSISWWSHPYLL